MKVASSTHTRRGRRRKSGALARRSLAVASLLFLGGSLGCVSMWQSAWRQAKVENLHRSIEHSDLEGAERYLRLGADPNGRQGAAPRPEGPTPIFHAAQRGDADMLRLLIAHGADVNLGTLVMSPLDVSAQKGHVECVKVLLANGAKVEHGFNSELSALFYAARSGHLDTVGLLIEHGAVLSNALQAAAASGNEEAVAMVVRAGADVKGSETPLHRAVHNGHREIAMQLLALGAEPTPAYPLLAFTGERKLDSELTARTYKVAADYAAQQGEIGRATAYCAIAAEKARSAASAVREALKTM